VKTIICIILLPSVLLGQQIGFSIDGASVLTNKNHETGLAGLSLFAGVTITDKFQAEAKVGLPKILPQFRGVNFAVSLAYDIYNPVYILGSFMFHSNEATSEEGTFSKRVTFIGAGAGVDIFEFLSFELLYYHPLKKEQWHVTHDLYWENFYFEDLTGIIKADLKFHWDNW
jgi:hypothetical protein